MLIFFAITGWVLAVVAVPTAIGLWLKARDSAREANAYRVSEYKAFQERDEAEAKLSRLKDAASRHLGVNDDD